MERKQYLAKNTALFALNIIGTKLIVFLLVPLYTRVLSTADYGSIDLVTTIGIIIVPIITLNINEAIMRFGLDKNANYTDITSIAVLFTAVSFALGLIIFPIVKLFPSIHISAWLVYLYCIAQGAYLTFSFVLRGQEKLSQYAIGNIACTLLIAGFNLVFLLGFDLGIRGYFFSYIISYFLCTVYFIVVGKAFSFKKYHFDKSLIKDMVKYSILLVPNSLMWWIMNSSDHIMVSSMIGFAANGIYAISYRIPSILTAFSQVINQAWSYSAIHEDDSPDRTEFNNNMYDKLVRFQLIVTVLLMLLIKPFLKVYVDDSFYDAWKYTPYLLIGYFFLTMGTFLSTSYTVNKDSKGFLYSGSIGAGLNVVLNLILIPVFGIHGAAFATCISYISVFIYRYFDIRKYVVIRAFKKEYVIGYLIMILSAFTMAIPYEWGYLLLAFETSLIVFLNRSIVKEAHKLIISLLRKKRHYEINQNNM